MKVLVTAASLACLLGVTTTVWAEQADYDYLSQNRAVARAYYGAASSRVMADGRCRGISYGTGARSCGTETGGPVGGISGRN